MVLASRRLSAPAVSALAALFLLFPSCGDSKPPTTITPPTTVAPTPPPSGGGGVTGASCSLGEGDLEAICAKKTTQLLHHIESAIDLVVREKPQLLDLTKESVPGTDQFRVVDVEGYLDTIVANLRRFGLCAERDPDSLNMTRVLVKDTNEYSETFEVLSDKGFIRRGYQAYKETCNPASFPIDRSQEDVPPAGSGCGKPYPPPIAYLNCKVHLRAVEYYTLDSTPIVGPDAGYCATVGFTDGREWCAVRNSNWDDRAACENWRVGRATDTRRPGPTWTTIDGTPCTGPASNCSNHPDNQYHLLVYRGGKFKATTETGASCKVLVER